MTFGTRIKDTIYSAGQPPQEQLSNLSREGFRRIIDLRPPDEDHGYDEPSAASLAGLEYLSLPVAGEADLNLAKVTTLDQWLATGSSVKTLIHCGSGNRVGALLALRAGWLHGASVPVALDIGRDAGLKALEPAVRALLAQQQT
jgi:protein tyrosine phosphatase (PTP) superfamily phosphohydrolase (DUF442 family)